MASKLNSPPPELNSAFTRISFLIQHKEYSRIEVVTQRLPSTRVGGVGDFLKDVKRFEDVN